MAPILFFIGFASILAQVVLLRELVVASYGSELVLLLAISIWMIWAALGALLGRRGDARGGLAGSLALLGLAIPSTVLLARGTRALFRATPGAFLPLGEQLLLVALTLAPAGILLGLLFVRAARRTALGGGRFANAYGIESLGGVVGGVVSTYTFALGATAVGVAFLLGAAALVFASLLPRLSVAARLLTRTAGAGLLAVVLFQGSALDRATLRWTFPSLLESRDSPYGRLTLTGSGGQVVLFESGALAFTTESTDAEELVHPALLQRENPKAVLLVGGAVSGVVREARKHRPERVEVVEKDPFLLEIASRHIPMDLRLPPGAEDVRLIVADARREIRETEGRFDAVLVDMPEPGSGAANRFFTREFFRDCARILRPGGVLAFRLPSAEQVLTPILESRNGSIYRALASVFADVVVLPGETNLFLASNTPLERDPEVLARRLETNGIETRLVNGAYLRYLYTNDRFQTTNRVFRGSDAPVNTDGRPICYSFSILLWLSRFYRPLAGWNFHGGAWAVGLFAPLILLLLLSRRSPFLRGAVLVGLAGFAGIVVEFALLLRSQTMSGLLYRDVGLLLAGFMGGLALSPFPGRRAARVGWGTTGLILALSAYAALTVLFFHGSVLGSAAVGSAWLGLGGLIVGGVFCLVAERGRTPGGALYAADLLGGSVGALAGSLLLLPILGMDIAVLSVSALVLAGLLLRD
jgi:spermidine synthase